LTAITVDCTVLFQSWSRNGGPRRARWNGRDVVVAVTTQRDEEILRGLNNDWIHSDQNIDVVCYEEFLAEDFTAT
jgi:hypothetical protein